MCVKCLYVHGVGKEWLYHSKNKKSSITTYPQVTPVIFLSPHVLVCVLCIPMGVQQWSCLCILYKAFACMYLWAQISTAWSLCLKALHQYTCICTTLHVDVDIVSLK